MNEDKEKMLRDAKYKAKYEMIEEGYKNIKKAQKKSAKLIIVPYDEENQWLGFTFYTDKISKEIVKDILDVIEEDINSEQYKVSVEMDLFQVDK